MFLVTFSWFFYVFCSYFLSAVTPKLPNKLFVGVKYRGAFHYAKHFRNFGRKCCSAQAALSGKHITLATWIHFLFDPMLGLCPVRHHFHLQHTYSLRKRKNGRQNISKEPRFFQSIRFFWNWTWSLFSIILAFMCVLRLRCNRTFNMQITWFNGLLFTGASGNRVHAA